ncbi:nucleotide/sugar transporter family protein [Actinidia rufa]|uniref:Nucleotide/sugar transporter family protein n=1 Tax=Actinidia rufa TaxID=165716 RepID=A0A7J0H4B1_9ERIC|nr:nucleotide/sugar transporter family protein [Actinidia rufa]
MTKLAIIPFTVLLETLFLKKQFSQKIKLSLFLLLVGVGIASVTDLQLNLVGTVLSLLAIITTCVGQIIKDKETVSLLGVKNMGQEKESHEVKKSAKDSLV